MFINQVKLASNQISDYTPFEGDREQEQKVKGVITQLAAARNSANVEIKPFSCYHYVYQTLYTYLLCKYTLWLCNYEKRANWQLHCSGSTTVYYLVLKSCVYYMYCSISLIKYVLNHLSILYCVFKKNSIKTYLSQLIDTFNSEEEDASY